MSRPGEMKEKTSGVIDLSEVITETHRPANSSFWFATQPLAPSKLHHNSFFYQCPRLAASTQGLIIRRKYIITVRRRHIIHHSLIDSLGSAQLSLTSVDTPSTIPRSSTIKPSHQVVCLPSLLGSIHSHPHLYSKQYNHTAWITTPSSTPIIQLEIHMATRCSITTTNTQSSRSNSKLHQVD